MKLNNDLHGHWSVNTISTNPSLAIFYSNYANVVVKQHDHKPYAHKIIPPIPAFASQVISHAHSPFMFLIPSLIIYDPVTQFDAPYPICSRHDLNMTKKIYHTNVKFKENKQFQIVEISGKIFNPLKEIMSDTTYPLLMIDVTYQCPKCTCKTISTNSFFDQYIINRMHEIIFKKTQSYVIELSLLDSWIHELSNSFDLTLLSNQFVTRVSLMHNSCQQKYIGYCKNTKIECIDFPNYYKVNHYHFIKNVILTFLKSHEGQEWIHYLRALQVQRPISSIEQAQRIITIDHSFESVQSSKQKVNGEFVQAFGAIWTALELGKPLIFRLVNSKANAEIIDVLEFLHKQDTINGVVSDQAKSDNQLVTSVCGSECRTWQDKWHSLGRILKTMCGKSSHFATSVKKLKQIFHVTKITLNNHSNNSVAMIAAVNAWYNEFKQYNKSEKFSKQIKLLIQDIEQGYFDDLPDSTATSVNENYHKHLNRIFKHLTQIGVEIFVNLLVLWFTLHFGKSNSDNSDEQPLTFSRYLILKCTNKLDNSLFEMKLPPMWSTNEMRKSIKWEVPRYLSHFSAEEMSELQRVCNSTFERCKLLQFIISNVKCMFIDFFFFLEIYCFIFIVCFLWL